MQAIIAIAAKARKVSSQSLRALKPLLSFYVFASLKVSGGSVPRSPYAATLLKAVRKSAQARKPKTSQKAQSTKSKRSPHASHQCQRSQSAQSSAVWYSTMRRLVCMYCRCRLLLLVIVRTHSYCVHSGSRHLCRLVQSS